MKYSVIFILILCSGIKGAILSGNILNEESREPVSFATVRVLGTTHSISSNSDGQFRLNLEPGKYLLNFSHVAHFSKIVDISVGDDDLSYEITLKTQAIDVGSYSVYDREYDAAQRIIIEAIKHKDEILNRIKKFQFDAYTKLIIHERLKEDSSKIMLLTETQLSGFWQYPNEYKEIITARRQSANLKAENNLVSIGGILNFNKNRLDLNNYRVVSPTASDALEFYNYYLLDTIYVDRQAVYLLEIEPKNDITPLFEGYIKIADSTYDVVGVDVTFNKGFDSQFLSKVQFQQIYSEFEDEYWMPVMINFQGSLDFKFPAIPKMKFNYTASLHNYNFNPLFDNNEFNGFVLEVDKRADDIDSSTWLTSQLIPLTTDELYGYFRIDSVETSPKPVIKRTLNFLFKSIFFLSSSADYFHFNRVEGAYLGIKYELNDPANYWNLYLKNGYAIDDESYQFHYRIRRSLLRNERLTVGVGYHDKIRTRETIISPSDGNSTLLALTSKIDPYDYFYEKGWQFSLGFKPSNKSRFVVDYNDVKQTSASNNSNYSLLNSDELYRPNPAIIDGRMRYIKTSLSYDSRKYINNKGEKLRIQERTYTLFNLSAEYSTDSWLGSDYKFRRYRARLVTNQVVFGEGHFSFNIDGGYSSHGNLPPQKYFVVDFGATLVEPVYTFHTFGDSNFYGSRFLSLYSGLDFGRYLFKKSRFPLIKDLPFSFSLHGGVFWSDFNSNPVNPNDDFLISAPRAYSEIGFGIGRLPLFLKLNFTWQLSAYDTNKFSLSCDFGI